MHALAHDGRVVDVHPWGQVCRAAGDPDREGWDVEVAEAAAICTLVVRARRGDRLQGLASLGLQQQHATVAEVMARRLPHKEQAHRWCGHDEFYERASEEASTWGSTYMSEEASTWGTEQGCA